MAHEDTGSRLRLLYEPQGGVGEVFGSKVADYAASRPDYPAQLFETLASTCGLRRESLIADVGAGTGLLTRGFLSRGYRVVAVEPNAQMRRACDDLLGSMAGYRSAEGRAERIRLESGSVDLVTAAQAFHWFDIERAREEFLRVLRADGQVALIWNDRLATDPLHAALDELFSEFGGEKRSALVAHEDRRDVPLFFRDAHPTTFKWPNEQLLTEDALLSLVLSRSYMPDRESPSGEEVRTRVRRIFDAEADQGSVRVRYTTVAIVGRPV